MTDILSSFLRGPVLITILNDYKVQAAMSIAVDIQPGQTAEEPHSSGNNALSWQSAFWALMAIIISTATQPSGRILGMPSEWGFALKLSPVMCFVNAVEALSYIRIQRNPWAVRLVPGKYVSSDEASPSYGRHNISTLQHNSALRITLFVLGPILQIVKLFAWTGIIWTQALATVYLTSFVCDELVLTLIWMTSRFGMATSTEHTVASGVVASIFDVVRGSSGLDSDSTSLGLTPVILVSQAPGPQPARPIALYAVGAASLFVSLFIATLLFALHTAEPNLLDWIQTTGTFIAPLVGLGRAAIRSFQEPQSTSKRCFISLPGGLFRGAIIFTFGMIPIDRSMRWGKETIVRNSLGRLEPFHVKSFKGSIAIFNSMYIHFCIYMAGARFVDLWNAANATMPVHVEGGGSDGEIQALSSARPEPHKLWWNLPMLWCVLHFLVGLLMYYTFFGARETFQPAWTTVFG